MRSYLVREEKMDFSIRGANPSTAFPPIAELQLETFEARAASVPSPDGIEAQRTKSPSLADALALFGLRGSNDVTQTGQPFQGLSPGAQIASNTSGPGETNEAAEEVRSITSLRYEANDLQAIRNALGYDRSTNLTKFNEQPNKLSHMFRASPGHVPDTPVNRAIIQETARTGKIVESRIYEDGGRFETRAREMPNGKESWSQVWTDAKGNSSIEDGGLGDRKYLRIPVVPEVQGPQMPKIQPHRVPKG